MNDDKIKILTEVSFVVEDEEETRKSEQILIELSSFDTLSQLKNHLCKLLKLRNTRDDIIDIYVNFLGSKIKLYDIKNFYFQLSNCVLLKEKLQIQIETQTSKYYPYIRI